ncbi:hypothetical protein AeMF1_020898 [Aphanomyces euteiches]|nr:hypothetical protein AeMF1_020898 [Aphanomyces euteiches]KAH9193108.1 hypothetical protein AeNC1_004924 [Aphanomyces euteiches]
MATRICVAKWRLRGVVASRTWMACLQQRYTTASTSTDSVRSFLLYADGASRGNPGQAGCGAVLATLSGDIVATKKLYLGDGVTNNAAEYHGLLLALQLAREHAAQDVALHLDSELVVKQMQGAYRVKNVGLQPLYQQAKLACEGMSVKFHAVPRKENSVADKLANEAIDDHNSQERQESK